MYALITTHRDVVMSVTVGADPDDLKAVVQNRLGHLTGPLSWTNYLSHEGVITNDGLTTHSIHSAQDVSRNAEEEEVVEDKNLAGDPSEAVVQHPDWDDVEFRQDPLDPTTYRRYVQRNGKWVRG